MALGCAPAPLCNTYNLVTVPMKNAPPYGLPDGRELTQLPSSGRRKCPESVVDVQGRDRAQLPMVRVSGYQWVGSLQCVVESSLNGTAQLLERPSDKLES